MVCTMNQSVTPLLACSLTHTLTHAITHITLEIVDLRVNQTSLHRILTDSKFFTIKTNDVGTGYPVLSGIRPGIRYLVGSGILYPVESDILYPVFSALSGIWYPVESVIRYYPEFGIRWYLISGYIRYLVKKCIRYIPNQNISKFSRLFPKSLSKYGIITFLAIPLLFPHS